LAKKKLIKRDLGHAWCEISDNRKKCLRAGSEGGLGEDGDLTQFHTEVNLFTG